MTKNLSGKDTHIIIARYDEGLSWVQPYLDYCIIYNKGEDNIQYPYISLKNIGLENYVWVHHIVENYDNLPEYLIFFQGSPHYHFIGNVERFLDRFLDQERRQKIQVEDKEYIPLTDWYVNEDIHCVEVYETYLELFGETPTFKKIEYATCGQFCVSSKRIKHYSKSFYEKFLDMFERRNYIAENGKNEADNFSYTAERMWTLLYSQKYLK